MLRKINKQIPEEFGDGDVESNKGNRIKKKHQLGKNKKSDLQLQLQP